MRYIKPEPQSNLLEMQSITKRFGPVTALQDVHLSVQSGEIHALLGENGAGKSTLMHILSGMTTPDSGSITLDGGNIRLPSPRAARRARIAMVHQHFTLVPAFTVEENLALDADAQRKRWNYHVSEAAQRTLERAEALGWKLPGQAFVSDLPVGTQQRVEIVKALATDARLLIFDEPTAVLAGDEVEELFGVLRRLRAEGKAIILIAHKLAEILAVADRVTVLRRGRNVATVFVDATNAPQLASWMVGDLTSVPPSSVPVQGFSPNEPLLNERSDSLPVKKVSTFLLPSPGTQHDQKKGQEVRSAIPIPVFSATALNVRGDRGEIAVRNVALEVSAGEIYGIGGVDGNGQTELAEALVGLRSLASGSLHWNTQAFVAGKHPRIGYIPQDRRRTGLATSLSVEANLLFDAVRDPVYKRGLFLKRARLATLAKDLIQTYDIRTSSPQATASTLSGGNQQKIVVARALHSAPEWIVAVNPTRGLDIGAARFVHAQLRKAQAHGAAICLISTDRDELNALATRQAILSGGILTPYQPDTQDATQIGLLLGGLATNEQLTSPPLERMP